MLQNNVTEFYHLVKFVRPEAFGDDVRTEADFENKYRCVLSRLRSTITLDYHLTHFPS